MNKLLIISALTAMMFQDAYSQDRVFTHTYQTNVLPLGVKELEYWNTIRTRRDVFYVGIDQRLELELGLGKNIQTAFYLNFNTVSQYSGDINAIINEQSFGFSNEWKIKLSDPVANKIGTGLYAEIGYNGSELELEAKILLDKKINDNLFAFNLVGEKEFEFVVAEESTDVETEVENAVELDFAYMRFLGKTKKTGLGLEIKNNNTITDDKGWEYSTWFGGPSASFGGDRWFINLNIMPQWFNTHKANGTTENLELHDHEKVETRVLVSFAF